MKSYLIPVIETRALYERVNLIKIF